MHQLIEHHLGRAVSTANNTVNSQRINMGLYKSNLIFYIAY